MAGLRKPTVTRLGVDVAGQVEAVGRKVTQFKPGDEVFGTCKGAFAEYVCASERALVVKPDNSLKLSQCGGSGRCSSADETLKQRDFRPQWVRRLPELAHPASGGKPTIDRDGDTGDSAGSFAEPRREAYGRSASL